MEEQSAPTGGVVENHPHRQAKKQVWVCLLSAISLQSWEV